MVPHFVRQVIQLVIMSEKNLKKKDNSVTGIYLLNFD